MKNGNAGAAVALALVMTAGLARAEEGASPAPTSQPTEQGHASGFMVQARLQSQGGLLSLGGGPGFLLGYQGDAFALGLGVGFSRLGASAGDSSASVSLFQIMPTALVDVWRSPDGRARANVIAGIGYGRASLAADAPVELCSVDPSTNLEDCSTTNEELSVSAGMVPVMLGFGGDYFLSRNFALGAEAGFQSTFLTGLDSETEGTSASIDAGGNLQFAYGVLRATLVLGN